MYKKNKKNRASIKLFKIAINQIILSFLEL